MAQTKSFSRSGSLLNLLSSKANYRGTMGSIRLKALLGNSASYEFQTVANVGTQFADEMRIQPNDAFIPTKAAMYIQKVASTLTDADQMRGIDRTFPNPLIFTGANEAANLEALYKGKLIWNINSTNVIETMDTLQFRRVGTAQQLVNFVVASPAGNGYQRDAWEGGDYGFVQIHNDIALNGGDKGKITLNLQNIAVDCSGTSSSNYVILEMRGIYMLNGAALFQDKTIKAFIEKGSR